MRRYLRIGGRVLRHPLELAEAAVQLFSVDLALRFVPFPTLLRWLAPPTVERASSRASVDGGYLWAVNAVGSAMFGRKGCLRRALAVCWYCRRRRIAVELRIGVVRSERGIEAHAWVDHGGRILVGGPASYVQRFAPLQSQERSVIDLFEMTRLAR